MSRSTQITYKRDTSGRIYKNILGSPVDSKPKYNDWVYVIKHPFLEGHCKIGSTRNLWERLRTIIGHMGGDFLAIIKDHYLIYKQWEELCDSGENVCFVPFPLLLYKYHRDNDDTPFEVSAVEVEQHLHKIMKHKRAIGEWFNLSQEDLFEIDKEMISLDYVPYIDLFEMIQEDLSDRSISVKRLEDLLL
jgi:hypothetical protein